MKPSKSLTSVASQQHQMNGCNRSQRKQPPEPQQSGDHHQQQRQQQQQQTSSSAPTSPICRCRVMYLGSSVPHITKDGLQGIQEPLRELYPDKASLGSGNAGIDSWLSVWSNGILIENVDETGREVKRFFKIEALHYCAAVKYVPQAFATPNINGNATLPHNLAALPKFLPLDSPHARMQQDSNSNPPIFASILRRTTGVKVLECHAFICKREAAANALVRCCFHAYADTMYAKQIGADVDSINKQTDIRQNGDHDQQQQAGAISAARRSKSIAALNDVADKASISDSHQGQNHEYVESLCHPATSIRRKSLSNGQQPNYHGGEGDTSDGCSSQRQTGFDSNNLQHQMKRFSRSMHQLNFDGFDRYHKGADNQATEPIFTHNPYATRVPSYPPQSIIDQQQQQQLQQQQQQLQTINGGTLRSVRSVAANSIASTLLRSKKHAKAMSMAQLNQQQQPPNLMMPNQPMSFHQHQQHSNGSFMTMPPVPPMFMPRANMNGSQTMKLPSRHMLQAMAPMPMNFEAMTPKEMKKLLKKSAKYGLNPGNFTDNGLPLLPLRPMQMSLPAHLQPGLFGLPPPPPLGSESGTFNSQSMFQNDPVQHHHQNPPPPPPPDIGDFSGQPPAPSMQQAYCLGPRGPIFPPDHPHMMEPLTGHGPPQPIKSILVKPNPEFLKSKAGKKWLKQQKEFKKLLPAHLDGLPIVFGPPPLDALESVGMPNSSGGGGGPLLPPPPLAAPPFIHTSSHLPPPPPMSSNGGLPVLDSNGFYNSHTLYGPSGRASAASTMLRNSPQVMQQHLVDEQIDYQQRNQHHHQSMYSNPVPLMGHNAGSLQAPLPPPPPPMLPPHQQLSGDELYGQHSSSQYNRQFPSGDSTHRRRNHMVEQSVISLGDEDNDEVEHGDEEADDDYERGFVEHNQRSHKNGYYNRVDEAPTMIGRHDHHVRTRKGAANGYDHPDNYQGDYEQITQQPQQAPNDDLNSNSSGIYRRRGHINERAFSYSIRQEASKSSADNSDAEYRNGETSESSSNYQHKNKNNNHIDYRLGNQSSHHSAAHYENPKQGNIYQNRPPVQYYKKHQSPSRNHYQQEQQQQQQQEQQQQQQQQPVDELTARLESQLNMKSFANSCVKSGM